MKRVKFDRIEGFSISSHIGDVNYEVYNGISLFDLRYISEQKTPVKSSEFRLKRLLRESIVKFGVRITQDSKKWTDDADIIEELESKSTKDSFKDN